ncbi:hypothetical protein [Profundibacterium mesophilum]|uniref:hypothetical protein n=1 Tax=Profundibacterium mesophilum TaxID=1258573 RepID=UPI00135C371F|nr:hypothetical protein [Profundibacterium mesophilum]
MRKKHNPTKSTRRSVEDMSACGIPQGDIARVLGIDPKTLRLHYRDELDNAATKANAAVAGSLYRRAISDDANPSAAIFWLKTRAQWRETPTQLDHTSSDGSMASQSPVTFNLSALSDEELDALERLTDKATASEGEG